MNSFGLGLVLNFVDNASAGMNTATNNFMRMSATADSMTSSVNASATEMASIAYSLNAVGDTFVSIGQSITGVFTGITQQVIDTGMTMQGYRMQLSALYGSAEAGQKKMEEIKQYAMSSVFDIQSLIPAVTTMKAVGIEAMAEVTTSSGNATQKLLDYASDLAAMMPNMRNAYGTGVTAAMGAFKEYIAEGNAMSLKRGAGLDITGILGEDKGATVEERTQQVADLIEKLNIVGYTASLAGTPTQRLSNMQDALFNSLSRIADSGVFEVYCGLLEKLSNWVFSLVENEETFNTLTGILADTITSLLSPLQSMLDWVIENSNAIIEWIKEHPKLTKSILLTVVAIGALLVVGGLLLKMLSSVAFAMSGLQMMKSLPTLLGAVGGAFKGLIAKALPFVALAALAYFVWKNNLFGIRDVVTDVMNDLGVIFSLVKDAWSDNTLSEENFLKAKELGVLPLIEAILQLKYYWDFFIEGFKIGFEAFFESIKESLSWLELMGVDVNGLASSLGEFLKSLVGVGAEEQWERIGKTVGELTAAAITLATVVFALKPIISFFSKLWQVVSKVGPAILKVVNFIRRIVQYAPAIVSFFKDFGAAISLMKEGFGFLEVMGAWFPKLAGVFTKLGFIASKVGGIFSTVGGWIVAAAKAIGTAIMGVLSAVAGYLGLPVWAVVAIIAAIVVVITLIIVFRKQIAQFFVWLWGKIKEFVSWLGEAISNLWNNVISPWLSKVIEKVKEILTNIIQAILSNPVVQTVIKVMTSIYNCISTVVQTIVAFIVGVATTIWNVIKLVGTIIAGVAKVIWAVISGVAGVIWTCIKGLVNFIVAVVKGVWNVIKTVANLIWTVIKSVVNIIKSIVYAVYQFIRMIFLAILAVGKIVITAIASVFQWLWGKIQPILQAIGNFFSFIFNWIKDNIIMPVVNWIVSAFTTVRDWIIGVLQAIGDFFASIFDWINTNVLTPFRDFVISVFDWINEKITAVTDWFRLAFETAASAITEVFGGIKDFFAGVWQSITDTAMGFFDWISSKLEALTSALSAIGQFFSNGIANAGNWFKSIGDQLANFVGLSTGGFVKETGLAVLHPNEVVVNDDTTRRLQNFLGSYEEVTKGAVTNSNKGGAQNYSSLLTDTSSVGQDSTKSTTTSGEVHNDYSVTFASGSVVIQLSGTSDADLEQVAEKLMKIIARKQQLRAMAVR